MFNIVPATYKAIQVCTMFHDDDEDDNDLWKERDREVGKEREREEGRKGMRERKGVKEGERKRRKEIKTMNK